ncbi:MAG: hypothetical protein JWP06_888 [Candidatus Saccharibacteria bacterium]|nr:hypothetical protein [Candidatus Saccharibacteria bacterium]
MYNVYRVVIRHRPISLVVLVGVVATLMWYPTHAVKNMPSPTTHHVLGATAASALESQDSIAVIAQANITQTFAQFDESLSRGDTNVAEVALTMLRSYQQQVLILLPRLSIDRKVSLARICSENRDIFETDLHILPEHDQMDGMLVLAGCQAIEGGAR